MKMVRVFVSEELKRMKLNNVTMKVRKVRKKGGLCMKSSTGNCKKPELTKVMVMGSKQRN